MARLGEVVGMAARSLVTRLGRSLLMMLGVTIGVAAVIALVSAGNGATAQVAARIQRLGANLLFVNPGPGVTLTLGDAARLTQVTPLLARAMPLLDSSGPLVYGGQSQPVPIAGVDQLWPALRDAPVAAGRFLSAADVTGRRHVVDLGATLAGEVFGALGPVGRHVRLDGASFRVIGVMAAKGAAFGQNQDRMAFVPVTTAQDLVRTTQVSAIEAQVRTPADAGPAADELNRYYAALYPGNAQPVHISSEDSLLAAVEANRRTFTMLLGGTAAISLVVGGIGIMNIMLVSVAERTREIGLRKAVGARFRDLLLQFLAEAIALAGAGGLLGVAAGLAGAGAVARLAGWHDLVLPSTVFLAFGFSLAVGVVFGAYPAARAAALDPIEALREM